MVRTTLKSGCIVILLICTGCVTSTRSFDPPGGNRENSFESGLTRDGAAARDLSGAQRLIRSGDYSTAIPRLMKLIQIHPESPAAVDARYYLGVTFYKIGGSRESSAYFSKYLELAPEGKYAQLSRDYLRGLASTGEHAEKMERQERIDALEALNDVAVLPEKLELANLYWESGDYEAAGEIYRMLLEVWPRLENDRIIRTRLERQPDGSMILLTPEEVERRYADADPLIVHNTASYRSGRYQGYQRHLVNTTYNVTGEVLNRSGQDLNNVELRVTIYGLGRKIYETKTVPLRTVRAGESVPFSVSFTQFDNIENVQRFECTVRYGG